MPQQVRYSEAATTPGLWKHTWLPIKFFLIVDDFGIEYIGGNMPTTSAKSSKKIMKSQKIGREKYLQALTWNGTIPPCTITAPAASQSKDTLKEYLSYLATSA